jgi:hypothetical protein
MTHQDFADLLGDLRPAAANEFVVHPQHDDDIAVPAITEPRT